MENKRLVQIRDENNTIEELYYFPDFLNDDEIEELWYKFIEYQELVDDCSPNFEDYLGEHYPNYEVERVFVDEIYVD